VVTKATRGREDRDTDILKHIKWLNHYPQPSIKVENKSKMGERVPASLPIKKDKMETTKTDLSKFGYRELEIAGELLKKYAENGSPEGFFEDGLQLMMNFNSGNVFLTNSEYQVLMMNGEKLEQFYSCPECGHEGFLEDMGHNEDSPECQEYLKEIGYKAEK